MNNVHAFASGKRTPGRRRARPMPGAPLANVFSMVERRQQVHRETPEEQVERLEAVIKEVSYHLLMAVRVITSQRRGD